MKTILINTRWFFLALCIILSMSAFAEIVTIGSLKYELNGTEAYVAGYVDNPTDVVIPETIESEGQAFRVTKVNNSAFYQCNSITSLTSMGGNLETINNYAFYECVNLNEVKLICAKTSSIGIKAFTACTNLEVVDITCTKIGAYAFSGCSNLQKVILSEVSVIGTNYAENKYSGSSYSYWNPPLVGYTFENCNSLTYIDLGDKLQTLDVRSFQNCTKLTFVVIPATCNTSYYFEPGDNGSNYYYFRGCSFSSASNNVFSGCTRLQNIIYLGDQTSKCGSNADVYNVNNMLNWNESSFTYSGKSPQPTFTTNLPAGFQPTSNAAQGNLEKNVGTHETTVPVTFRNSEMEFTASIAYTYTVTPATLTARVKNVSREYGEANPQFSSGYSGFVNGENSSVITNHGTYSTNATTKSSVGTYGVTQSGASATNYTFQYESGTLTVTKAPLTMTPRDKTMTYGDPVPNYDVDYMGLKNGETKPEWITEPTISTTASSTGNAGNYLITISGGEAKNYNVSFKQGTLTIDKAALTLTTQDATREYGDDNPEFKLLYTGLKNGETAPAWSVAPTVASSAQKTSPVGVYNITVSGGESRNYVVTQYENKGKLTINKAPLTAKARSYTKKQGEDNPALAVDYTGFKNGETKLALTQEPVATTKAQKNSSPGTYPITLSDGIAMNYALTYVNGTLTILPNDYSGNQTDNTLTISNLKGNKNTQVTLPIGLKNKHAITGFQLDMYLPDGVSVATNSKGKPLVSTTNRMAGSYTITGNQMNGYFRIVGYSGDSEAFTGNDGNILNVTLNIGSSIVDGEYTIRLKDIVLSDVNNTEYHPVDVGAKLTVSTYTLGDVDNSGAVNINDVVCIINYILNRASGVFVEDAADVDCNGSININDVVTLINRYILKRTNARAKTTGAVTRGVEDNNYLYLAQIDMKPGETKEVEMLLTNTGNVAAAQGNIKLPEGLSFVMKNNTRVDASNVNARAEDYTLSCALQDDGSLTFAQYSPDGYIYEGKSGAIFKFKVKAADNAKSGKYQIKLSDVVLSVDGVGVDIPDRTSVLNIEGGSTDEDVFDVGDLTSLINYIMKRQGSVFKQQYDLNKDGDLNIGDVILMIKVIHQSNAARTTADKARSASSLMSDVDLSQFTAAQFIVSTDERAKVVSMKLKEKNQASHKLSYEPIDNGLYSVVVYSKTNQLLAAEEDGLLDVQFANGISDLTTSHVVLSTPEGERTWLDSLPTGATTGIVSVTEAAVSDDVYNLNGSREPKDGLRKGIYIMNGKKTVVR